MALVVKTKTDFWGLVEQKGPWATTPNDVKNSARHPAKRGGAIQEAAGGVNARRATFTPSSVRSQRVKGMSRITLKSLVSSGDPRRLNGGIRQPREAAMRRQVQPTSIGGDKVTNLQDFQGGDGVSSLGQKPSPEEEFETPFGTIDSFDDDINDVKLEQFLREKGMIGEERFSMEVDLPEVPSRRPSEIAFEAGRVAREDVDFPELPVRDLGGDPQGVLERFRAALIPGAFPEDDLPSEQITSGQIPDVDSSRSSIVSFISSLSSQDLSELSSAVESDPTVIDNLFTPSGTSKGFDATTEGIVSNGPRRISDASTGIKRLLEQEEGRRKKQKQVPTLDLDPTRVDIAFSRRRATTAAAPGVKRSAGAQDVRVGKKQKTVPTLDLDPKRIEIEFGAPRGKRDLKKVEVVGGPTEAEAELLLGLGASAPTQAEAELLLGVGRNNQPTEEEAELLLGVRRGSRSGRMR